MCEGRRFQADGAATEKELFESWPLDRGTIKSPRDVDRSRMSEHGCQSWVKYVGVGTALGGVFKMFSADAVC